MDQQNHNNLLLKLSTLFPSSLLSCQSNKTLPDSSIIITKTNYLQKHPKNNYSALPRHHSSDAEGRKCPPVTPLNLNKKALVAKPGNHHSSSSNSGRWFTSSDERTRAAADGFDTDTFYSLSSNSGDSLRLRTRRRRTREEMKSIDETGQCSFPSRTGRRKAVHGGAPARKNSIEPGSDHASTRLYYQSSLRRRRTSRSRRKTGKSPSRWCFSDSSMIRESLAVEKSTSNPYRDFRTSMVEMIIEKQMFGAEELDKLLHCFLSLNKGEYHGIIFEVFSEICQTLFCN